MSGKVGESVNSVFLGLLFKIAYYVMLQTGQTNDLITCSEAIPVLVNAFYVGVTVS